MLQAHAALEQGSRVLVAGSTGGVGQLVVAKLVSRGFKVRALTRDRAKAETLLRHQDIDIVELDPRDADAVSAAGLYQGVDAFVCVIGTTAFPSDRWVGNNGPRPTDYVSPRNLLAAAPPTLKHVTYCSSAGVERFDQFPFFILNTFGVLMFKKASEELVQRSGLPFTIVRPGRLTDGPYTSYDLNTLLQATSGQRQDVQLSRADDLNGEASRIATAELLVQSLLLPELEGATLSICSTPGEGPGSQSSKWRAVLKAL